MTPRNGSSYTLWYYGPVRQAVFFLAHKPGVADLLREKNTVSRLISRADKLSRTWGILLLLDNLYLILYR
jgi:hypothetical protein